MNGSQAAACVQCGLLSFVIPAQAGIQQYKYTSRSEDKTYLHC